MLILILENLYAIMQYFVCVKLVGIELATSLPVQYDIRNCSSWTRYRRREGRGSGHKTHVPKRVQRARKKTGYESTLGPPAISTVSVSTFTVLFGLIIHL